MDNNKGFYNLCCKDECSAEVLAKWLAKNQPDIGDLLRACDPTILKLVVAGLLRGSEGTSLDAKDRRFRVADAVISVCSDGTAQGKDASETLEVLIDQIHSFSALALVNLIDDVVESIEEGGLSGGLVFAFIPPALSKILPESVLCYEGDDMKGGDYRALVVGRILRSEWRHQTVVQLLGSVRDIQLTDEERKSFVDKAIEMLVDTQLASLPPLVYQVMLLAGKGDKGTVIRQIANHFEELDRGVAEEDSDALRQTEHTVLLHIDFALKQDAALGGEFLRALQKKTVSLSPFIFSLLLSMSRVHRHQDRVLKFLTQVVVAGLRVEQRDRFPSASNWLARARDPEYQSDSVRDVLLASAKARTQGWNPVIEPLVSFAMGMMESKGAKDASSELCMVGRELLEHAFRAHGDDVRLQILSMTVNHILTHTDLAVNYVELLKRLVNRFPHEMAMFHNKLKEMFDHLAIMSPPVAFQLVQSVMPLMTMSGALKDHLMIVLRKAMFRGQAQYQLCAAGGFVEFLVHNREQKHHAFEAITFLERGLSQHPDIRRVVYRGLVQVVRRNSNNSEMNKVIGTVLAHHMNRFVDLKSTPPIQLERCMDGQQIVEPLGALIHCAQFVKSFGTQVKKLVVLMRDLDLEDFTFDKTSVFDDTPLGVHNRMCATLLCEAYVAALEFQVSQRAEPELADIKTVCKLFRFVTNLRALMDGDTGGGAGGPDADEAAAGDKKKKKAPRKKKANNKAAVSAGIPLSIHRNLDASSLRMLVMLSCSDVDGDDREEAVQKQLAVQQQLRDDKHLLTFVLEQLLVYVSTAHEGTEQESGWRWAVPSTLAETEEKREFCKHVGPAVFCEFQRDQKAWNEVVANTIYHMMKMMYGENKDTEVLLSYMQLINPQDVDDPEDLQSILLLQLSSFYSFLGPMVDGERWKEVIVLFRIMELLYESLEEQHVASQHETLAALLCLDVKNASTAKAAVSLFLALAQRTSKSSAFVQTLCREIQGFLGEHDDEEQPEEPTHTFKIINAKTITVCIGLTFAALAKTLDEVDAVLPIIKGNERTPEYDGPRLRKSLHKQLKGALNTLSILEGARFDWGAPAERIVRMATKLYTTITKLVKIYTVQKYKPGNDLVRAFMELSRSIESMYPFLEALSSKQDEEAAGKQQEKQMKANHRRESKLKPALIYSIEMLETTLIKYQDQAKVGLMKNWKRSTVRDFRIDKRALKTIQTRLDGDDDEEEQEEPRAKKTKKQPTPAKKRSAKPTANTRGKKKAIKR